MGGTGPSGSAGHAHPSPQTPDRVKAEGRKELRHIGRLLQHFLTQVSLGEDLAASLTDGVVLCHIANHCSPRSVSSIHVPSPAVPKLSAAKCRRNVDNFLAACRKIGVREDLICSVTDISEPRGSKANTVRVAVTVTELLRHHVPRPTNNSS